MISRTPGIGVGTVALQITIDSLRQTARAPELGDGTFRPSFLSAARRRRTRTLRSLRRCTTAMLSFTN
jgi:hypothetical protein